jgi:signal transduction histidine kinase
MNFPPSDGSHEARLARQIAQRDRLFSVLAHDLRGPVGNLASLLEVIEQQQVWNDEVRDMVHLSQMAAAQTFHLLENLLEWIRGQMDEIVVLTDRVVVAEVLATVQDWLSAMAAAKSIQLRRNCSPSLSMFCDARVVETIVRNLVLNALKFSPPGTEVVLQAREEPEAVVVEVVDCGVGIAPERVPLLFSGTPQRSTKGTSGEAGNGLGLMFCYDLAQTLGGHLEVDSVVGAGSTFRLVLPNLVEGELS